MVRLAAICVLLLWGAAAALRLGWAEFDARKGSVTGVEQALGLLGSSPDASYLEILADADPGSEEVWIGRALEENPRLTSARMRLGLLEEQQGDPNSAERTLLTAARYDHQYLPAWTLANYYFRRGNPEGFWQWSRIALRRSDENARPILRLASLLESDEEALLNRLQASDLVTYTYLDFQIGSGRLDSAQRVARLALRQTRIRRNQLLDLCSRQLRAGNASWALELWNALNAPLDPERGPVLAEPVFGATDGQGFRVPVVTNKGISAELRGAEANLTFDGSQADSLTLLDYPIPAPNHRIRYRVEYQYRTSATGVRWSLAGQQGPEILPASDWRTAEWVVAEPASRRFSTNGAAARTSNGLRILSLELRYHREPGTTPARGELAIRDLHVKVL